MFVSHIPNVNQFQLHPLPSEFQNQQVEAPLLSVWIIWSWKPAIFIPWEHPLRHLHVGPRFATPSVSRTVTSSNKPDRRGKPICRFMINRGGDDRINFTLVILCRYLYTAFVQWVQLGDVKLGDPQLPNGSPFKWRDKLGTYICFYNDYVNIIYTHDMLYIDFNSLHHPTIVDGMFQSHKMNNPQSPVSNHLGTIVNHPRCIHHNSPPAYVSFYLESIV